MRRKDKELSDPLKIREILSNASFCHVAMCNGDVPYCIPMCFVYKDGKVYLHSAGEGRKIEKIAVIAVEITSCTGRRSGPD